MKRDFLQTYNFWPYTSENLFPRFLRLEPVKTL